MPSIKELREICQGKNDAPGRGSQSYFGYYVVRGLSIYLTRVFIHLPFTPNQVTAISVVVFLAGVGLFAAADHILGLVGAGLVVLSILLDGVDGELARYRKQQGGIGGDFVEPVSHDIQYGLMFLPIGWGAMVMTGSIVFLLLGVAASLSKVMHRLLELRFLFGVQHIVSSSVSKAKEGPQTTSLVGTVWYRCYRNIFTASGVIPPLVLVALTDRPDLYVLFYGVSFPALYLLLGFRQWRKIRMLGRPELR